MKKYVVHSGYRKSKPVTAERIQQRYADGDILNDATVQESGTTFSVPIAVFINDCVMNSRTKARRRPGNGKRRRRKTSQTENEPDGFCGTGHTVARHGSINASIATTTTTANCQTIGTAEAATNQDAHNNEALSVLLRADSD